MNRFLIYGLLVALSTIGCSADHSSNDSKESDTVYPAVWFEPINDPKKPDWEIML